MRSSYVATLGVASLFALGCTDSSSSAPTDPGLTVRSSHITGGACTSAVTKIAKTELTYMLSGSPLRQAQRLWKDVEGACNAANPDDANAELFAYAGFVRDQYPAGFIPNPKVGTPEANFLGHLNTIFAYAGYPEPGVAGGSTGPLTVGIVAVIEGADAVREYQREHLGAFMLPVQDANGDARGHLFVMTPGAAQCLSVDNLTQLGNCIELNAYPAVAPQFSPGIKVGLCAQGLTAGLLSLGHETSGGTEVAGNADYPTDCHVNINVASSASRFEQALTRFASRAFGVRLAYATDKGLGGIGSTLSPWGPVDALIFGTSFNTPHVVGSPPSTTDGNFTFSYQVTSPGSILIQNSLGNQTGPLVVLSQGGGACTACGGLELRAHFFSASGNAADDGTYEISWKSVQSSPGVKGAPFVVRGSDTAQVARVTYVTNQSTNRILFNNVYTQVPWVRNQVQRFKVIVNLDDNWTRLYIDDLPASGQVSFLNPNATNIARLAAEFSGIDSGVMGWDEISVKRIADQ